MEQSLKLRLEPLGNGIEIFVSDIHRFGTDAILLADFASPKRKDMACDLGTGCGIIPFLWSREDAPKEIYGVEIQPDAAALFERSIDKNGLIKRVKSVNSDLKDLKGKMPSGCFDIVTCNPPYKKDGAGIKSKKSGEYIARHEAECTFLDICRAAARLLESGGRFCVCHRPERLSDIISDMREVGIEPKRLRTVSQRDGLEPWLVLVEGKKGAKSGMRILPTLFVEKDGVLSDEMMSIYGPYKPAEKNKV